MIKRTLIWVSVPLVLFGTLSAFSTKEFHAEAVIAAPPDRVWDVLIDTAAYPDWNPVFVRVRGDYAEGATVKNSVMFPEGEAVEMDARVEAFVPGREIRQTGGVPLVLTFDNRWVLEPVEGGTRVVLHEVDRGFYLWFWDSDWVEPAYQRTVDALRERVLTSE